MVSYTYTSRGQVASRRDQFGHTEYFQYDKEGRQVVQVDRKGNRTQTRFNAYGKPVYQACTDRKGKRQVMGIWAYDDFGHLKEAKGEALPIPTGTGRTEGCWRKPVTERWC